MSAKRATYYTDINCSMSAVNAWPERTASISVSRDLLLAMVADALDGQDRHPAEVADFVAKLQAMLDEHAAAQPSEYAVALAVGQAVAR